jgi:hypothetical protein
LKSQLRLRLRHKKGFASWLPKRLHFGGLILLDSGIGGGHLNIINLADLAQVWTVCLGACRVLALSVRRVRSSSIGASATA